MCTRPTLSVAGITSNSGHRLADWIARAREYADEVVLLVDENRADDTYEVARDHADRVTLVEHAPHTELWHDLALRQCSGDWILWLDDDEVMNVGFAETRDQVLAERRLTHFWVPYRWVVPDAGQPHGSWLTTFPWHPNPRLRLVRNVASLWFHRGRLHSPIETAGEGRLLDAAEATMYHLDMLLRDRADREAKVARYRRGDGPSCEEYYLYEDYAGTLGTAPVPEPLERAVLPHALESVARRRALGRLPADDAAAPLAVQVARLAGFWDNAPVHSVDYLASSTPATVHANRGYTVEVTVRNTSPVPWRSSGPERGRIQLGYHWSTAAHGVVLREGDRSLLPADVGPGETVTVLAGLWTPYEPGSYTLEWDLVAESVAWFSERGAAPLPVSVEVDATDRLLAMPRRVATLPPIDAGTAASPVPDPAPSLGGRFSRRLAGVRSRFATAGHGDGGVADTAGGGDAGAGGGLAGANVVPVRAVRVLDTRDGSGAPGARLGPIAAGDVVTLTVAGHADIPDWAVGVVGTVSVPDADYHGFVTVYAGAGQPTGHVNGYFTDATPAAVQVLSGVTDGRLSIWLSDNFPGRAQLLFDVTAYLRP